MNTKKALAVLLTAAQIIEAASLIGAAEFPEDELTAADVKIEASELGEVTEDFGGAEEIGLIAPGDEQERVWVRRIELNMGGDVEGVPMETWDLSATVTPRYANNTEVRWWSDNEEVVRLIEDPDDNHHVTVVAVANGWSYVHCAATDRDGVEAGVNFHIDFQEDGIGGWEDYVSYGTHNYYRYTGHYSWFEAKRLAEEMGGYLATITSQEEMDAVNAIIDRDLWIGLTDEEEEGNWQWVTGEPFEYSNWSEGEPNDDSGVEEWVHVQGGGGWNDHKAYNDGVGGFILEVELPWIDIPDFIPSGALCSSAGEVFMEQDAASKSVGKMDLWLQLSEKWGTRGFDGEESWNIWQADDRKYCGTNTPFISVMELPEPTEITGFALRLAGDSSAWPGRLPDTFFIAFSNDLENWDLKVMGDSTFFTDVGDLVNYGYYVGDRGLSGTYRYVLFEMNHPVDRNSLEMQLGQVVLFTGDDVVASGVCGENITGNPEDDLTWTLEKDGLLTIRGNGDMFDYSPENPAPWAEYADQILTLYVDYNTTYIGHWGAYAFTGCDKMTFAEGLIRGGDIGAHAFEGVAVGNDITIDVGSIQEYAFANSGIGGKLTLGNGIGYINEGAFLECHNLHGELVIPANCSEINARAFEEAFDGNADENRLVIEAGDWDGSWDGNWENWESNGTNPLWIQDTAFYACRFGGGLYLPDRVQEVGNGAFDEAICWGELRLSNSLTGFGEGAFSNNNFDGDLEIPEGVTRINDYAFAYSSFNGGALIINEGLEEIGGWAFTETRFDSELSMPDSLRHICDRAFYGADFNGHELLLNEGLEAIDQFAFHGANFGGSLEIPASVNWIGNAAFCWSGFNGELTFHGNNVTVIQDHAFANVNWTGSLVIPESVTEIQNCAFDHEDGGNFYSAFNGTLTLPANLTTIGDCAFRSAGFSGTLTLGNGLTMISHWAFANMPNITGDLVIPDSVEWIGNSAFRGSSFDGTLTLGTENSHLWQIQNDAFRDCGNLHGDIVIPDSVTDLGGYVFFGDGGFTGSLIIGDGLGGLPEGAFPADFTGDLVIGNGIDYIPQHYFERFNFTGTLTIGDGVRNIDDWAFHRCQFTGHLTMGANVERIGRDAFSWSYGYTGLTLNEGLRVIEGAAFFNGDDGESGFRGDLVIPDTVDVIQWWAFDRTGFNGTLTLGEGLTFIGDYAFNYSGFGGGLTLPANLQHIGQHAFDGIHFVGDLVIPDQVGFIGDSAFSWAEIDTVTFNGYVDTIENEAFDCEGNLTTATFFGNAPANFGERVFNGAKPEFTIYYDPSTEGWSTPEWNGYPCYPIGGGVVIYEQPTDIRVTPGTSVTFHVGADGVAAYQWQYSANNGGSWRNVAAASSRTADYTMTAELRHNGYIYRCMLTDDRGNTVYTDEVLLTVSDEVLLTIISDPQDQNVTPGTVVHFIVEAEGKEPLNYQWQYSKNNGASWVNVVSAAGKQADYSLTAQLKHNLYLYRCKVTDADGNEAISGEARLIVEEETGITILTQPVPQTVTPGTVVHFIVEAEGNEPLTYQWQYSKDNGANWVSVTANSGKQADYILTAQLRHNGYLYRCVITDADGNEEISDEVRLTVAEEEALRITAQPSDTTVSVGSRAVFAISAEGVGTLTYQWQYSTNGGSSWVNVAAASGKTDCYTLTAQARHNGYMYRCIVTDSADGTSVTSDAATLTVTSASGNGFQPVLAAE